MRSMSNTKYFSAETAVVPKIFVTVQLSDSRVLNKRKRPKTTDIAGKYVCCFSSRNVTRKHVYAKIHRERQTKTFIAKINRSTYYARNGFESIILRFIRENPRLTFVAPSYCTQEAPRRDHITDTQLYVSGSVEEYDSSPEEAARREIREEIGLEVSSIVIVETINGDTWFHATLG